MSSRVLFLIGFVFVAIGLIPFLEAVYQGSIGVRSRGLLGSTLLIDRAPIFEYWSSYDPDIRWELSACDDFGYSFLYRLTGGNRIDSISLRCENVLKGSGALRMPVFRLNNGDTLSCAQFLGAGTICVSRGGKAERVYPNAPKTALDVVVADAMGFQRGWALGYGYILFFYMIISGFLVWIVTAGRIAYRKLRANQKIP